MTSLDALLDAKTRRNNRGCYICGDEIVAAVAVRVHEMPFKNGRSKSRTLSFCASHALDKYERLLEMLEIR